MEGADPAQSRWRVPMELRTGAGGLPQTLLLVAEGQVAAAGRCDEPLSLNAAAIGFYRVAYDATTLETDRLAFHDLPGGDRIALLDDQWALVQAGQQQLARYLGLAEALGGDLNDRAWSQVIDALVQVETYERGTPGHDAFTAYARSLLVPLMTGLGWDARPDEGAPLQHLRRQVIRQLGQWGDAAVVAEARRRFEAYLADPARLAPDDQSVILSIIATNADQAAFDQLHGLLRTTRNETELERYLTAIALARDPRVAQQALAIALSPEVPPQADAIRLQMVLGVAARNPALAWQALRDHVDQVLAAHPQYAPLYLAQQVPDALWNGLPLDQLEAWLQERIPPEMAPNLARGMQAARFRLAGKARFVADADAYVAQRMR
jgi:aminopeptidase N